MEAVTRAVQDDEEILNRTSLEKKDIIHLNRLCLESTFFQYNNKIYKQITGTPMGSPIWVVIAEIVMQKLE